ncbi:MAG TPA: right-handed parallel beta-helix repeat-containing protein [Pelolinea sp.]|nr:right-handed parallel beta-helix repeat-containing protein [Pelolinea sp.]
MRTLSTILGRKNMIYITKKTGWAIAIALLAALLLSTAVFAEGETPESSEPEVPAESAEVTGVSLEEPSAQEEPEEADAEPATPEAAEENPEDTVVIPAEEPISEGPESGEPSEPLDDPDLSEDEPQEEPVLLVDSSGEALDMASQESAESLSAGDPWWISGGVKYAVVFPSQFCPLGTSELDGTCWKSDQPITAALEKIDTLNLLPSDGMVFVENGDYAEDVLVDGLAGNMVLQSLKGILGFGSSMVNLTGNITVTNTIAGFTLMGFTVDGGVVFSNNTGNLKLKDLYITNDSGDGLVVENHNGPVELTDVQSRDNKGDGARIDNSASLSSYVKVTNSAFDYNDDENDSTWNTGLKILTNGPVTLEGVASSRNNGNGTEIYGFSQLTINNSLFDRNNPAPYSAGTPYGYGLYAETAKVGNVKISNVFAYFNDNNGFDIHTAGTIQMDYVRGSHSSVRTGQIDPAGETVYERLSEDNKYTGDRWYFNGTYDQDLDISLSSYVFDTYLELRNASDDSLLAFNDDMDGTTTNSLIEYTLLADGEYYIVAKILESTGGLDGKYTLALNDPTAANETEYNIKGALLDNTSGTRYVKINNAMFQDNVGDGLEVNTLNTIYLNTIDASHNSMRGAFLDNCHYDDVLGACLGSGKISITSPSKSGWYSGNYFLDNGGTGLEVVSKGSISLTNVGAYDNLGAGVDLRNDYIGSPVTINTNIVNFINVFRNNGSDGVKINSLGSVSLRSNEANYNAGYGFYISTKGKIVLRDLAGNSNGFNGLYANNQVEGTYAGVALSASKNVRNTFKQNGANEQGVYPGVEIRSYGSISLLNLDAKQNYAAGAYLTNKETAKAYSITLTDCDTSENQGSGLLAYSKGTVNIKGLVSSYNSMTSSDIVHTGETVHERLTANSTYDNWWFAAPPGTSVNIILESKEFNAYLELYNASGDLIAWDDNSYGDNDAQINIPLPSEGTYYIHVRSADLNKGNYTLSVNDEAHSYSTYFNFYGALVDNTDGTGRVSISPTKTTPFNVFNDNAYRGLQVNTNGKIVAYEVSASDNGDTGAYLFNPNGTGSITLYTKNKYSLGAFNGNTKWGIYAVSARTIALRNVSADLNGEAGAYLNNCLVTGNVCNGAGGVTISSAYGLINQFSSNQKFGLWISSSGSVKITDIHADANGLSGLYVKNSYDGLSGYVYLKASKYATNTFLTNVWASPSYLAGISYPKFFGLEIYSYGTVSIYRANVQTTYGTGAWIQNHNALTARNLTIQDSTFEANQGYGLVAYSKGSITLKGVDARYNSLVSGQIDIYGETIFEHLTPNHDADIWWFDGFADDEVDAILTSEKFDAILELYDKDNNLIAADDDSYGGTNARITINLPADGEYYLKVRQNGAGDGNYVLSLNDEYMYEVSLYEYSGAYLDNTMGTGNVSISSTSANGSPSYYHNNFNGLTVKSAGAVSLSNVYALQNGADGANISNYAGLKTVTVSTSSSKLNSSFSYNTEFGLYIQSRGKVTIKNSGRMYLRDNGYSGAYIDNTTLFAPDVEVSRVEVNNNTMKGLEIYSTGDVTLNNILAINNLENGVYVDNCDWDEVEMVCKSTGYVNIRGSLGVNNISDNGASGLAVYSNGNIMVDKVYAIQNAGRGMRLNNDTGFGYVTITNTIARLNENNGLEVITKGAVTAKYVHSMSNGLGLDGDGIYLRAATPARMIFYKSSFLGNEGSGIDIAYDTWGIPTLNYVSYFGNDTDMDGDLNYYAHAYVP